MVQISVGALRRMCLTLAATMEVLIAVADLRSVDDGSGSVLMVNIAGAALVVAGPDGVVAVTKRRRVAVPELAVTVVLLSVARWLPWRLAVVMVRCRCVEEDGGGCCILPARMVGARGSFAFLLLKLTVVMGDGAAVAFVCEEDGGAGTWCSFTIWLRFYFGPRQKWNTMAVVHLEPRHKRNSMASGNNRGQKECLLASSQYVSVLDPRQNEENNRDKKYLVH
ncbi:hypothetical protein DEO72_LG2g1595 [Vigna unguiculata]|uniref:Uncharacterized protein n=1 Tax=Vigna unguiculata TaxID=3917 RepID=A0A4D6KWS7_VIGUN|nr:hypothetical protein DEO72_LG2g1595 [Vigna unguiculata]